jgi:hypothetical protein
MEMEFRMVRLIAAVVALLQLVACGDDSPDEGSQSSTTFRFSMDNDVTGAKDFIATTSDVALIKRAREQLQLPEGARTSHINGAIVAAAADENLNWGWRFRNESWNLAEVSMELCDGNAQLVEQDLAYWLNIVGRFCPWGARVAAEVAINPGAVGILIKFRGVLEPTVMAQRVLAMQQIAGERGLVLNYGAEGALAVHRLDLGWTISMQHADDLARAITTRVPDVEYAESNSLLAATALTFEIEPTAAGFCRLTMEHDLTGAPGMAAATQSNFSEQGGGGWNWILSDMKSLLETGKILSG